ncbi:MAG: ABC transporter substrate-binding protein, partial [Candidatus Heimdallarchaeota archaeon]
GQTEFHYATPADFEDFHIYKYESVYDAQWLSQIYNGLAARNAAEPFNRGYAPRLAASYDSTDGLTYVIEIDADATWADGTDLTTADVEFSYDLQVDPDFGNPALSYWQKYYDGTSISITDAKNMEITFLEEYVFQDGNLALDLVPEHIWGAILPEDMEAQAITWATSDPNQLMGAGPYYLEEYDGTNGVIHLTRNDYFDDWSDVTPFFADIYFEFYSNKEGALSDLASGAIDMVDSQFSVQLDEVPTGTTNTLIEDPGTQEIAFNCEHPYLGTGELAPIAGWESGKNIRKAISSMIPREIIVEEILNGLGEPGSTGCPSVAIGYDATIGYYPYSIDIAKAYMEAAGFEYVDVTTTTGLGLYVVIGILGLAGASQVFFLKRRK